ncbi:hypothetical protein E1J38_001445 [Seonamhaeicola sediminis]|uniref:Uncharacterized protein n=1 Tax=Seonamhaeicola sediminis TaxID=2528206 RepID=A0A562YHJ9_9FLAO|nr:BNR repeat-containing protein [Seonamhaeicola sediminis]TWO34546.1 hypothetical protein E1J38_001445 [Seonamhaeicola sediminis]
MMKRYVIYGLVGGLFLLWNSCKHQEKNEIVSSEVIEESIKEPTIVEQITVDSVWAANGVAFDLQTFGNQQYVAYFDKNRMMTVASRQINSNHWIKKTLPNQLIWDSHNYVSLGIDEMGYIHVSGNMHVDPLAYFKSEKPWDVTTMVELNTMVGDDETRVTYPKFFNDKSGRLLFSYRSGSCGNGNILINHFSPKNQRWERYLNKPLFEGVEKDDDRAAYHKWVKDSKGNFHFVWMWRWTPDVETSHNIGYAKTPDLKNWVNGVGQIVNLPFKPEDEAVMVDATPSKGGLHNSRYKLFLTPQDEPIIGYTKYDEQGLTQLYLAKLVEGKWISKQISKWNFRWKFIDGGAFMTIGGTFDFVGISNDNILAIDWETEKGESGRYMVDLETLEPTGGTAEIQLKYPKDLEKSLTNREGMLVRIAYEKRNPANNNSRYVLKWEAKHGGFRQHAPKVIPEGPISELILLKIQ